MRRARFFALMSALVLAAPVAALAQGRFGPPAASSYNRFGYEEGYRRGEQTGQNDGRRGVAFNFTITGDYRSGDTGYRSQYGTRDRYRIDFRAGFEAGYRTGYGRFGRNTNNGYARGRGNAGYGSYGNYGSAGQYDLAANQGFQDGYEEGLNDGRKRHSNDPRDESRYRDGDRGYERFYGALNLYRANYRRTFIEGYEAGYRDGWSYR
jgi:hypothetical protein